MSGTRTTVQLSDAQQAVKQMCRDFFRADEEGSKKYARLIDSMVTEGRRRLVLDMQDLHNFGGGGDGDAVDLGHQVLLAPQDYVRFLDEALREVVEHKDFVKLDLDIRELKVGFEGYFGRFSVSPRQLGAWHLNKLVALEGVVTHTTANIAKVVKSVHWNEKKNSFIERQYRDQMSPDIDDKVLPTVNVMPKKDIDGNLLRTEHGLCMYTDMQNLVVQERPEKAPVGSLPRSVEVRVEGDLVDACKPGDRVRIVGIYMPYTENNKEFRTTLLANNVSLIYQKEQGGLDLLPEEIANIRKMSKNPDIFKILSSAIAPSIFGHDQVKKAILLQMLGGVEKDVDNHHIRGDIHLLLVGEPATAKSQLLRFVMKLAPFALSTTGKGSSGVGLTGAVVTDPDTGDKTLAAGAMVLADRGVLCIDEFDKMGDGDRVAMHEAMEQGSVTIAKAGIQATLNGRCSVVAAANPVYGFYAVAHSVAFNIGLPESLLSRFDLLFIILDDKSSQWTRLVADHVLRNHRTGRGITIGSEMEVENLMAPSTAQNGAGSALRKPTPVYVKHNPYEREKNKKLVSVDFLRMYIQYAKQTAPVMTDVAREKIEEHWIGLRKEQANQELEGTSAIYINPRTLESLIRLSSAHAKCRLSDKVQEEDVDIAIALLRHAVNARQEALAARLREKKEMESSADDKSTDGRSTAAPSVDGASQAGGGSRRGGSSVKRGALNVEFEQPGAKKRREGDGDTDGGAAAPEEADVGPSRLTVIAQAVLHSQMRAHGSHGALTLATIKKMIEEDHAWPKGGQLTESQLSELVQGFEQSGALCPGEDGEWHIG